MNETDEDKIFEQFAKIQQLDEEADEIISKFNKYFAASITGFVVFIFLFACFSFLNKGILVTLLFLLFAALSLLVCFMYSGKYMFAGFARISGMLMKLKFLGIIISIIFFAFWFLFTFMFPFLNILSVKIFLKKQSVILKKNIEQIKMHPDFKKLLKTKK